MSTNSEAVVEYRFEGDAIDLDATNVAGNGMLGRHIKRKMRKIGDQMIKQYGHLVHPETGERPTLVVNVKMPKMAQGGLSTVEKILVADSESLRDWLRLQGVVVAERDSSDSESEAA